MTKHRETESTSRLRSSDIVRSRFFAAIGVPRSVVYINGIREINYFCSHYFFLTKEARTLEQYRAVKREILFHIKMPWNIVSGFGRWRERAISSRCFSMLDNFFLSRIDTCPTNKQAR